MCLDPLHSICVKAQLVCWGELFSHDYAITYDYVITTLLGVPQKQLFLYYVITLDYVITPRMRGERRWAIRDLCMRR